MAQFRTTPIEQVQEYWDRRPCNLRHSPRPIGSREYFDEVEERKYLVEPHIAGFADFARWRQKRVLEVGCGIGTDTINFARSGATVTAVDLSSESLEIARRRSEVFGLEDRINFVQSNAEELDGVPDEPVFDLVYSFGVIHHTPHPGRVLAQIRTRLAPEGELRLMVYHRNSWKVGEIVAGYGRGRFWDLDRLVAAHSEAQMGCPVAYTYTRRSVREWLEQAGYRVTAIRVDHIFPYRVRDYIEYHYVRRFPFNVLPAPVMRSLERRFGWHLLVSAVRDGSVASAS